MIKPFSLRNSLAFSRKNKGSYICSITSKAKTKSKEFFFSNDSTSLLFTFNPISWQWEASGGVGSRTSNERKIFFLTHKSANNPNPGPISNASQLLKFRSLPKIY